MYFKNSDFGAVFTDLYDPDSLKASAEMLNKLKPK
jgi:hypothetical protein